MDPVSAVRPVAAGGRPILHPGSVSPFSHWSRHTMPGDRALTDIDGLAFRNRRLEGLVEHRSGGYVGTESDNRSLEAIRRLTWVLGLGFDVVDNWRDGMVDCRFGIWLAYEMWPAPRLLAAFETPGNVSPVTGRAVEVPTEASVQLAAHCAVFELPYRSIPVRPDTGRPVRADDIAWLVDLPLLVKGQ